jgi:endonuclease/exonuclease/phosphatase (EEP) superfamily protein YafD
VERGIPFYFYVVHTSAPVSNYNFQMRNEQLKKLKDDFLVQAEERAENAPVILVGDFNLSPWSAFYAQFERDMEGKLKNVFRNHLPNFTRSAWGQKVLKVHIDHVFVSSGVKVGDFVVNDLPGSDHRAVSFDVELLSSPESV